MFSYAINVIPDYDGRPQHVGSVINKYVLTVKFIGRPCNILLVDLIIFYW
jgi:hypothetical protein